VWGYRVGTLVYLETGTFKSPKGRGETLRHGNRKGREHRMKKIAQSALSDPQKGKKGAS